MNNEINRSSFFSDLVVKDSFKNFKSNGEILLEDKLVAKVVDDEIVIVNSSLCPLRFFRNKSFPSWCKTRIMDLSRTNSRLLRKALKLNTTNSVELAKRSHCCCITDRYWFKDHSEDLSYKDVKFSSDKLSDLALYGRFSNVVDVDNTELSNTGSFEKCWKLVNSKWYLFKSADRENKFSEYFIYKLGEYLGFNMAKYFLSSSDNSVIISLDFTENGSLTFEPFESLVGMDSNISTSIGVLKKLGRDFVIDYLNMIFLDVICFNQDRHTFNYGVIRDLFSGDIVSLAPNFDNNLALTSLGRFDDLVIPIGYESDFIYQAFKNRYDIPFLSKDIIEMLVLEVSLECNYNIEEDVNYVIDFVWNNYNRVVNSYKSFLENEI